MEHAVHYRCYFLNLRAEVATAEIIEADTDAEAVERANMLFSETGSGFSGVEVWDRGRRVAREFNDGLARSRHWRMKAEEIRTAAESFTESSARQHMRNSAETYEALANAAEAQLERRKNRKAEELREQSRLSRQACMNATSVEMKREHAGRAFALAQLAEKIEREAAEAAPKAVS